MLHCGLLLVLLNLSPDVGGSISKGEVEKHMVMGKNFLAQGQLQDALTQYHAAVDGDPSNYLSYYERGIVYLALGKATLAIHDLEKVLGLKPDFSAAKIQRANVNLKLGNLDEAEKDFNEVLQLDPNNQDAFEKLEKISTATRDYLEVEDLMRNNEFEEATRLLTKLIETCPWAAGLREMRANCHVRQGDHMSAISDVRSSTKLQSDNTVGYYKLSKMLYHIGHVEDSLKEIRECLKLDPEHKDCFPIYKKIKKIAKLMNDAQKAEESRDFEQCVTSAQALLKAEPDEHNVRFNGFHLLCKCNTEIDGLVAVKSCQEAVKIRRDPTVLCDSAEAYLAAEMFDDAIRELKGALEIDSSSSRAKELLQKAQQRQKMSESRDYYKILGVSRTATKREIIKAYRKAAQKWHPDNFPDETQKKKAENKFIDIAAAKEVLTDEEKRAKFDRGEDPLDPESGKHSGFNPFQEFHQFHGSPFQFKFHFN